MSEEGHTNLAFTFLLLYSMMSVSVFQKDDHLTSCLGIDVQHFSDQSSLKYVYCIFMVLGDGQEFTIIEEYDL